MNLTAFSTSVNDIHLAVGIWCLSMNALANSLLDSIWAAFAEGPKHAIPGKKKLICNLQTMQMYYGVHRLRV